MTKLIGGVALLGLSLFMLLGFVAADASMSASVALLTFTVAVLAPGAAGGALVYLHLKDRGLLRRREDRLKVQTWEAEVLKLAEHRGGRLTLVELLAETAMGDEAAATTLASLVERGMAEIEVTDSGVLVYSFHDIQKLGEKASSRRVLDA